MSADFLQQLKDLVITEARAEAQRTIQAAVAETADMQRRADALICDAEVLARKGKAIEGLIAAAAKASQDSFLASAARTEVALLDVGQDVKAGGPARIEYSIGTYRFFVECGVQGGWQNQPGIALPAGRYTVVLSLYRQDPDGEVHKALAALRSGS